MSSTAKLVTANGSLSAACTADTVAVDTARVSTSSWAKAARLKPKEQSAAAPRLKCETNEIGCVIVFGFKRDTGDQGASMATAQGGGFASFPA